VRSGNTPLTSGPKRHLVDVRTDPRAVGVVVTQLVTHRGREINCARAGLPVLSRPRRGSCGIPSTWHSPTTRRPGGSPRRVVTLPRAALPPGRRVVALREVDGMPHPAATPCAATPPQTRPSRRPAARRGHEHFGVNADADSRLLTAGVVVCRLTCVFLPVRLGA